MVSFRKINTEQCDEKKNIDNKDTCEKKLKNLSKNFTMPFTLDEVITDLSNYQLSDTERDLLKYGLSYAKPPRSIDKTNIFTIFEKPNQYLCTELKDK